MVPFPAGFEPSYPDVACFARWVELAAAVGDRDPVSIRACYEATGRLLGWMDVHEAQSGGGLDPLVGFVIQRDLTEAPQLTDEQCVTLLEAIMEGTLDTERGELRYALKLLQAALEQPRLTDLIYWPRVEFKPARVVELAREYKAADLNPYLDPLAAVPCGASSTLIRYPSSRSRAFARELLARLAEEARISLHLGERTAWDLALYEGFPTGVTLGAWLEVHEGIEEVSGSDDELNRTLEATRR